jgi:hypothetical protein
LVTAVGALVAIPIVAVAQNGEATTAAEAEARPVPSFDASP